MRILEKLKEQIYLIPATIFLKYWKTVRKEDPEGRYVITHRYEIISDSIDLYWYVMDAKHGHHDPSHRSTITLYDRTNVMCLHASIRRMEETEVKDAIKDFTPLQVPRNEKK